MDNVLAMVAHVFNPRTTTKTAVAKKSSYISSLTRGILQRSHSPSCHSLGFQHTPPLKIVRLESPTHLQDYLKLKPEKYKESQQIPNSLHNYVEVQVYFQRFTSGEAFLGPASAVGVLSAPPRAAFTKQWNWELTPVGEHLSPRLSNTQP